MFNELIKQIFDAVEYNHEFCNRIFPQGAEREYGKFDAYTEVLGMIGHSTESACYYQNHFIAGTNKKCLMISELSIDGVMLLDNENWTEEFLQKYGATVKE